MTGVAAWTRRWLRGSGTILGQIRVLFLVVLLPWPAFVAWSLVRGEDRPGHTVPAVLAAVALVVWLCVGYRRQHFPMWTWIPEGLCVCMVAAASDFRLTRGLWFAWIAFRALYGPPREKLLAAAVTCGIAAAGVVVFDVGSGVSVPTLVGALTCLAVSHLLAWGSTTRQRAFDRERTLASASAGLVAATSRAEALTATLRGALDLDDSGSAAVVLTVARSKLRVIAAAGDVGDVEEGRVTNLAELPDDARAALRADAYVTVGGETAAAVTGALGLPPHRAAVLTPLAVHDQVFGLLVVTLDRRPADELSASMRLLAGEAALTLDQLLTLSRLRIVVEHSGDPLILAAESGVIRFVNPAAGRALGCADLVGRDVWSLVHPADVDALRDTASEPGRSAPVPCRIRASEQAAWTPTEALITYVTEHDGSRSIVLTARDVTERHRLELELRHAQKLESVGRLAAGIAHEINTPIQFVGDNIHFLNSVFTDLQRLLAAYQDVVSMAEAEGDFGIARQRLDDLADEIDLEGVMGEVPVAVAQTLEGVDQVARIVRALKAFGHPGTEDKSRADLNEAIRNTVVVAGNEIRYVADVETDLGDLPPVGCHLGDINQVVLNLVVNAAHAIGAAERGRGTIRISTRLDGDGYAVIEVADTGTGVPPEIADKLFEPFFTTKPVGSGTGQGLALARTLVTDRHGGTITFSSTVGVGTVFTVRLPVGADQMTPAGTELAGATR